MADSVLIGVYESSANVLTSGAVALSDGAAVGDHILLSVSTGANPALTVTDSKGNTWALIATIPSTVTTQAIYLYATRVTNAVVAGDTITVARTPTGGMAWTAHRKADLVASPFGTPVTAAAAVAGSPAGDSVVVPAGGSAFMAVSTPNNVTVTPTAPWAARGDATSTGTGNPRQAWTAETNATANIAATLSSGGGWAAVAVPLTHVAAEPDPDPELPGPEYPDNPFDCRIPLFGDSNFFRTGATGASPPSRESITKGRFEDDGFDPTKIFWHAVGGKAMLVADSSGKTTLQNIADAVAYYGGPAHIWIIALGTNDTGLTDAEFTSAVNTIMDAIEAAGGGTVLWVNLAFWSVVNTNSVRLNPLLKATVEAKGGKYLDWNTYIHSPGVFDAADWIYPEDATHYTVQGYQKRDQFVIDAALAILADSGSDQSPLWMDPTGSGLWVPCEAWMDTTGAGDWVRYDGLG